MFQIHCLELASLSFSTFIGAAVPGARRHPQAARFSHMCHELLAHILIWSSSACSEFWLKTASHFQFLCISTYFRLALPELLNQLLGRKERPVGFTRATSISSRTNVTPYPTSHSHATARMGWRDFNPTKTKQKKTNQTHIEPFQATADWELNQVMVILFLILKVSVSWFKLIKTSGENQCLPTPANPGHDVI